MSAGTARDRRPARDAASSLAVTVLLVAGWALVSHFAWVPPVFLPSPGATAAALWHGLAGDELAAQLAATVGRLACGWALASLAGIAIGAVVGASPRLSAWLRPTLEFMRPLPASALIPVAIALVGLSPAMVLAVIAFGAMWPVLLATVHGVNAVEPRLREVAAVLRLSGPAFMLRIGLPNALPDVLSGLRLSLTVALILAIVGEMLASQNGLGTAIVQAARSFRSAELFAGVALLGAIGFASNALLSALERRLLRWKFG